MFHRSSAIALASVALLLTACSSSVATPVTSNEPAPTVAPAAPTNEELTDYFAAVAQGDPVELKRVAETLAAPDSNAYAYAIEQAAVNQAMLDGGWSAEAQDLETIEGGFAMCAAMPVAGEETCSEFTNLTYVDGRLADFDAGGSPLAGRISLGNGESVALGDAATATFIAAYRSIAGAVYVVVEIRSNVDGLTVPFASTYRAPDGRQADPTDVVGPYELGSGSLANYAFVFQGAEFGGTLDLVVYKANYDEVGAQIPTT